MRAISTVVGLFLAIPALSAIIKPALRIANNLNNPTRHVLLLSNRARTDWNNDTPVWQPEQPSSEVDVKYTPSGWMPSNERNPRESGNSSSPQDRSQISGQPPAAYAPGHNPPQNGFRPSYPQTGGTSSSPSSGIYPRHPVGPTYKPYAPYQPSQQQRNERTGIQRRSSSNYGHGNQPYERDRGQYGAEHGSQPYPNQDYFRREPNYNPAQGNTPYVPQGSSGSNRGPSGSQYGGNGHSGSSYFPRRGSDRSRRSSESYPDQRRTSYQPHGSSGYIPSQGRPSSSGSYRQSYPGSRGTSYHGSSGSSYRSSSGSQYRPSGNTVAYPSRGSGSNNGYGRFPSSSQYRFGQQGQYPQMQEPTIPSRRFTPNGNACQDSQLLEIAFCTAFNSCEPIPKRCTSSSSRGSSTVIDELRANRVGTSGRPDLTANAMGPLAQGGIGPRGKMHHSQPCNAANDPRVREMLKKGAADLQPLIESKLRKQLGDLGAASSQVMKKLERRCRETAFGDRSRFIDAAGGVNIPQKFKEACDIQGYFNQEAEKAEKSAQRKVSVGEFFSTLFSKVFKAEWPDQVDFCASSCRSKKTGTELQRCQIGCVETIHRNCYSQCSNSACKSGCRKAHWWRWRKLFPCTSNCNNICTFE